MERGSQQGFTLCDKMSHMMMLYRVTSWGVKRCKPNPRYELASGRAVAAGIPPHRISDPFAKMPFGCTPSKPG